MLLRERFWMEHGRPRQVPIILTWKLMPCTHLIFIPGERARRLVPGVRRDVERAAIRCPQVRDRCEDKDPCGGSRMIRFAVRASLIGTVRSGTPARAAAPRFRSRHPIVRCQFQRARSDRRRARTSRLLPLVNVDRGQL